MIELPTTVRLVALVVGKVSLLLYAVWVMLGIAPPGPGLLGLGDRP